MAFGSYSGEKKITTAKDKAMGEPKEKKGIRLGKGKKKQGGCKRELSGGGKNSCKESCVVGKKRWVINKKNTPHTKKKKKRAQETAIWVG